MQLPLRKLPSIADNEEGSVHVPTYTGPHGIPHLHLRRFTYRALLKRKLEQLTTKLQPVYQRAQPIVSKLHPAHLALMIATPLLLTGSTYASNLSADTPTNFSLAESSSCVSNFLLFPDLHTIDQSTVKYNVQHDRHFHVGPIKLASRSTCVEPLIAPKEESTSRVSMSFMGFTALSKNITVSTGAHPELIETPASDSRISTIDPLSFALSDNDVHYSYALHANKNSSDCTVEERALTCPVKPLKLEQSERYTVQLSRSFNGGPADRFFTAKYDTATALVYKSSSIRNESTVYSTPKNIALSFSRPIEQAEGVSLTSDDEDVAVKTVVKGKTLKIVWDKPLDRQQTFSLKVGNVIATDRSSLKKPVKLSFTTSGGPRVIGSNIGSTGFGQNAQIVLTFDSPISSDQNLNSFLSLKANGKSTDFSVSRSGNQLFITPSSALPWCKNFSISVLDGLKSQYGIAGGSATTLSSRTICYTTQVIGYSRQGRAIVAYKFGTGAENILFIGGTHGDEPSSVYILNSLIGDLDARAEQIPKSRSVYIVPSVNPDGIAAGTRVNAKGIDLNRNFPANDWKKDVRMPDQTINKGGGGSAPLSEPESAAIANFTTNLSPKIVFNYHAVGGLAVANESGNSTTLGSAYATSVGYSYLTNSTLGNTFNYDTTGAYSNWLHDKYGTAAVLIELWSYTGNEFSSHSTAIWNVIRH